MLYISYLCLLATLALAMACGGSSDSSSLESFDAADAPAIEQLVADLQNYYEADFKVTYETSIGAGDTKSEQTVTWYRIGTSQRFDFEGSRDYHYYDRTTVFTTGFKDRTVLCSDELPASNASKDQDDPSGGCCEGSSTCGDLAANIVVFLGFPLGFEGNEGSSLQITDEDRTREIKVSHRTIAGHDARCYEIPLDVSEASTGLSEIQEENGEPTSPSADVRCFGQGAELLMWNQGWGGPVDVAAGEVGSVDQSDLGYPYTVYEMPNG